MDCLPLVCDYGSGFSKVGFAGSQAPVAVFPTILGKLRHDNPLMGMQKEDWFIGQEAQKKRGGLSLQYPISRGAVVNWDNMQKLWHHSFYQKLHIAPEQHPLMLTESPLNPMSAKERATQILFETFNIPGLYLANQGVLSLYASGKTSGTVIECGEGMTYFVPIINGCALQESTLQLDVAGQDLTLFLLQLLTESGNLLLGTADRECVRNLKEKCCYVAWDFDAEKARTALPSCPKEFQLPDGQQVSLRQERFICPEALFQTSLIGRSTPGVHMLTLQSITSCNGTFWKTLYGHILLSGGTSCCSGLRLRLQREVTKQVSSDFDVKSRYLLRGDHSNGLHSGQPSLFPPEQLERVRESQVSISPDARFGAWVGGSILCSLSTFRDMWVTRSEYDDIGSCIVSRKSF